MNHTDLRDYHRNFLEILEKANSVEEDYYGNFKILLSNFFKENDGYYIQVNKTDKWTHNIDKSYIDKPDFLILKRKIPILRIEGKVPDDNIERNLKRNSNDRLFEQVYRYRGREGYNLPVCITDFKKLWIIDKESLNSLNFDHKVHCVIRIINTNLSLNENANSNLTKNFNYLTNDVIVSIDRLQNLIEPLAEHAKILHDEILSITLNESSLNSNEIEIRNNLIDFRNDLKKSIFKDSKIDNNEQFADFFAQAIIYSSFLGWLRFCKRGNAPIDFKISNLHENLPKGTFIQKIFINLRLLLSEKLYSGLIESLENLLSGTEFTLVTKNIDILMATFYSDFLNLYDAEKAKKLGVVFTPTEIVDFIVDGIDKILIEKLKKPEGILSKNINFLDPASGTMSFACSIARKALEKIEAVEGMDDYKILSGFENWIKNYYLKKMFAFEILMAPYILGHLKTMITIEDLGVKIDWSENQLNSFLMNTLMEPPQEKMDYFLKNKEIQEEVTKALYTRDSQNIMVVLGNPPYNISSQNVSNWIKRKMKIYKKGLTETNLKILSDDYIKFLRFAHWRIAEKSKMGIIGFITNNKYFYGEIFRKMRGVLKKDFDLIYTVNLHGDLRKGEGGNPFDIRVGVGIVFLVRLKNHSDDNCEIYSWDIPDNSKYGKFSKIIEGFQFNKFKRIINKRYFIKIDAESDIEEEFNIFPSITDFFIMKPYSGIMSGRDALVYNISNSELVENYYLFYNQDFGKLEEKKIKVKNTKNWNTDNAINRYNGEPPNIIKVNYRGFDVRYLLYDSNIVEGHRKGYLDQISEENPAISTTKSVRNGPFSNCLMTKYPIEKCFLSVKDTSYAFLLKYNGEYNIRIPEEIEFETDPEELFYYIYAILYSNKYRHKYSSQLLRNYPRIPIILEREIYINLSRMGFNLGQIHLFYDDYVSINDLEISDTEDYMVYSDFYYNSNQEMIHFGSNPNAFWVKPISKEVWDYHIGGRKQIYEWLNVRKFSQDYKKNTIKRPLKRNEIQYFLRLCISIVNTIEIVEEIDNILKNIL